jgi:hypothetical protein
MKTIGWGVINGFFETRELWKPTNGSDLQLKASFPFYRIRYYQKLTATSNVLSFHFCHLGQLTKRYSTYTHYRLQRIMTILPRQWWAISVPSRMHLAYHLLWATHPRPCILEPVRKHHILGNTEWKGRHRRTSTCIRH